jgi:hypothetical protein
MSYRKKLVCTCHTLTDIPSLEEDRCRLIITHFWECLEGLEWKSRKLEHR